MYLVFVQKIPKILGISTVEHLGGVETEEFISLGKESQLVSAESEIQYLKHMF